MMHHHDFVLLIRRKTRRIRRKTRRIRRKTRVKKREITTMRRQLLIDEEGSAAV